MSEITEEIKPTLTVSKTDPAVTDALKERERYLDRIRKRKQTRRTKGNRNYIENNPVIVNRIIEDRVRGKKRGTIARECGITSAMVKQIETKLAEKYETLKGQMAGVFMEHSRVALDHATTVLKDANYRDAMVGAGIAFDKALKIDEQRVPEQDELQVAAAQANAITAKIQAETIKILMQAGAFNSKPPEPIDITPVKDE